MFEKVITAPEVPVVTVEEQCAFSHIDVPGEDDGGSPPGPNMDRVLIEGYIAAATEQIEDLIMCSMISQRRLMTLDWFPGADDSYQLGLYWQMLPALLYWPNTGYRFPQLDSIELIRRPVQDIDPGTGSPPDVWSPLTIKYIDLDGNEKTMPDTDYVVFADKITLKPNCCWPVTATLRDAVRIEYPVGYGDDPSDVPTSLKLAVKFLAGHYYENRVPVGTELTHEVLMTLTSILNRFKLYRVPR